MGADMPDDRLADGMVEPGRDEAVGEGAARPAGNRPDVRAGPDELVEIVGNDPGGQVVEAEALLGGGGISTALPDAGGGLWVTGATVTMLAPPRSRTERIITQGRSFVPSSRPCLASSRQR